MQRAEMVEMVRALVGDPRFDGLAEAYLDMAQAAIVARRWPYRDDAEWAEVPEKYHMLACEAAAYLVNRRGAEGETSHSESGTSRTYESAGLPDSMMRMVVPVVGVPG